MKFMNRGSNSFDEGHSSVWADEFSYIDHKLTAGVNEVDWLKEFEESKKVESKSINYMPKRKRISLQCGLHIADQKTETENADFWNRLSCNCWNKISEKQEFEHPWLSEYTEIDPYKVSNQIITFLFIHVFTIRFFLMFRNINLMKITRC